MALQKPVTHRFRAFLQIPDLDLYYKFIAIHQNKRNNNIDIDGVYGDYLSGTFTSKKGGFIHPETNERIFEYVVKVHSRDHARKFSFRVSPLFGADTMTVKGNRIGIDRVGTQIDLTCSYYDLPEMLQQLKAIFKELRINPRIINTIQLEESTIIECERHWRYDESFESAVSDLLTSLSDLAQSSANSSGEIKWKNMLSKVFYKAVKFNRWDSVFPDILRAYSLKSYRITDFADRALSDPLSQPKIEAFFAPAYNGSKPKVSEYDMVIHELDTILQNCVSWLNIQPVYDSFFVQESYDPDIELIPYPFASMMSDDESLANRSVDHFSARDFDFFEAIAKGYDAPRHIADLMGVSLSSVYNYISKYRSLGLIELKCGAVSYISNFIKERFKESFEGIRPLRSFLSDSSSVQDAEDVRVHISKNDPNWFLKKWGAARSKNFMNRINVPDPGKLLDRIDVEHDYDEYVRQWGYFYQGGDVRPPEHSRYKLIRHLYFTELPGKTNEVPVYYVTSRTEYSKLITQLRKDGIFAKVYIVPRILPDGQHIRIEPDLSSSKSVSSPNKNIIESSFVGSDRYKKIWAELKEKSGYYPSKKAVLAAYSAM